MNEVALLKQGFQANFNCDSKRATPQILMHEIIDSNLRSIFPNIFVAARIFLAIPPTVATRRARFQYFEVHYEHLDMLSINADVAKALSFDDLIDKFASQKVRKGLIARRP